MTILEAKQINKFYEQGNQTYHILKNISLTLNKGDFLGIVGPSGSGKTTLLYCLSGLESIENGLITFNEKQINLKDDKTLQELRKHDFGFVFQFFNLIPNLTVYENILVAQVIANKHDDHKIMELLEQVGIAQYKDYYPDQLSGGMQQRVAIARALVNDPKIIFADEPTGNLDQKNGKAIMDLLKKLNEEHNLTIILVTHNEDYLTYCTKTLTLIDGEMIDET